MGERERRGGAKLQQMQTEGDPVAVVQHGRLAAAAIVDISACPRATVAQQPALALAAQAAVVGDHPWAGEHEVAGLARAADVQDRAVEEQGVRVEVEVKDPEQGAALLCRRWLRREW